MIDPHSARLAQMIDAARGAVDVPAALVRAGFLAGEILDELPDVIATLQRELQTGTSRMGCVA